MQVLKTEVLNELYDRTESRIKDLHSFRQLLISIKSFEEFSFHKIKFTQFFFDIEDEMREALQNQKSAYIEIKELKDQMDLFKQRYAILETKQIDNDTYIKQLKENIKECLEQLKIRDTVKINDEKYTCKLENQIKNLQLENKMLKSENYEKNKELNSYDFSSGSLNINNNASSTQDYSKRNVNNIKTIDHNNKNNNNKIKIESNNVETILKQENSKPQNFQLHEKEEIKKINSANPLNSNNNLINNNYKNQIYNNYQDQSNIENNRNQDNAYYNISNTNNALKSESSSNINNLNKSNEAAEDSMDNSFLYKIKDKLNYSQYNEIITERENSKKLINDFIKESLSFNYNNNNINNYNINNPENLNNLNFSPNQKLNYNYDKDLIDEEKKLITFGKEEENKNNANNKNENKFNLNKNNNYPTKHEQNTIFNSCDIISLNKPNDSIDKNDKEIINSEQSENLKDAKYSDAENQKNKITKEKNNVANNNNNNYETNSGQKTEIQVKKSNENINNNISFSPKSKNRADKILEIVIKIRTVEDISSIVFHLFGEDILDKIISPTADEDLIEKVDATIQEIEKLMQKEEYTETEPLQDPPKRIDRHHPSIIEEKDNEESTFMNNTLNNKESSNNLLNNQNNELVNNNKNSNLTVHNSTKNIASSAPTVKLSSSKNEQENAININNFNYQDFDQNIYQQSSINNANNPNKIINQFPIEHENHISTPSLQSPSNLNLKTFNDIESNYSKMLNSNLNSNYIDNKNYNNQNTYTNPNLSNSNLINNQNFYLNNNNNNNNNYNTNNNNKNAYNVYSSNSNDISKTSYDILAENNLKRSGSKFKKSVASNNRSFSKPIKEVYSSDSAAASRINFEKSLRSYGNENQDANNFGNNNININRLNTSVNANKRIFNNYMKNKGELFDNKILKRYDAEYESRRKSRSKPKSRMNCGENSQKSIDIKSIKEMQKFRELYEKFKHLALQSENTNFNTNTPNQGFIKRPSNENRNIQQDNNNGKKPNANEYLFNDEI